MAGVVLAFSLVQADGNQRSDQAEIGHEAAAIAAADRALLSIGLAQAAAARAGLADFARSQAGEEWPALAEKGRDPRTERRFAAVAGLVNRLEPQTPRQQVIYGELVKAVDALSDAREALIEDAGMHLPAIFWIVSSGFVVLGLVLAGLSEAGPTRAAAFGVTAAAIGLLYAFVLIVDRPFAGDEALRPTAIVRALSG